MPKPAKGVNKRTSATHQEDARVEELLETIERTMPTSGADSGKITTGIDTAYGLVKKSGKVKLGTLAKSAGVSRDMALHWVRILEHNSLVKVRYPLFGDIEVVRP